MEAAKRCMIVNLDDGAHMEILLLGPPLATIDGQPVAMGPRKQRLLLAVLALEVNAPVSSDRLIGLLWPDGSPPTASGMIHTYVSGLRKALSSCGARDDGVWLHRHDSGYLLTCDPQRIDAHCFDLLLAASRRCTGDAERLSRLNEAISLWRGPALAGLAPEDVRSRLCRRLQEARITATEERIEAMWRLGEHHGMLDELFTLIAEQPMRPRLTGALMQALHVQGRTAEALEIYSDLRQRMHDELGLDPPAPLQELQLTLLRNEPLHAPAVTSTMPVPRQLPGDLPTFTGRIDEIHQLIADLPADPTTPQTVVVNVIDGMPGVGKTALAVHVAHQLAAHYPDGQIFLDLHGHSEDTTPVEPGEALDQMLRALGIRGDQIPAKLDARAALWRSQLAGQRVLIVLDNAAGEHQVRYLLPGTPGCFVLVTSRRRLTALDQTRAVSLELLPLPDAVHLLIRAAGQQRLAGQPPELLAEIAELCGRLPLAIRIAAARFRSHPAWSPAYLASRLRAHRHRLAELEAGPRSVAAALDLSYQHLTQDLQRTYRLLGLHPGPAIDAYAAAALTGCAVIELRRRLERLIENHLLHEPIPGRYRFHDLIAVHAAHLAVTAGIESERRDAFDRLIDHYAYLTAAAINQLYPRQVGQQPRLPAAATAHPALNDPTLASTWLAAELPNLIATAHRGADNGRHDYLVQLSSTLGGWLRVEGRHGDAEHLHQHALEIAHARSDHVAELDALVGLGHAYRIQARYEDAARHLHDALTIARATGAQAVELDALAGLARINRMQGRYAQAIEQFELVLDIARTSGDRPAELEARLGLGWIDRLEHRYEQATHHMRQAQDTAHVIGNRRAELDATNALGILHRLQGRHTLAIDYFEHAKQVAHDIGNPIATLIATFGIANILQQQGHYEPAAAQLQQVLDLARTAGNRNWQFEAIHGLGRIHRTANRPDLALACHQQALQLATDMDQPIDQARAHSGLAYAHHALGQRDDACEHWRQALNNLTSLGVDHTEDEETTTAAIQARLRESAAAPDGTASQTLNHRH